MDLEWGFDCAGPYRWQVVVQK